MHPTTHVFNQYYFELLKKLRDKARSRKLESREARNVLKGIKEHYQTYDKTDDRYRSWFEANWTHSDGEGDNEHEFLYEGVKTDDVKKILDTSVLAHFIALLKMFKDSTLTQQDTEHAVNALRSLNIKPSFDEAVAKLDNESLKQQLQHIFNEHAQRKSSEMDDTLKRIEGTSLGKLAKDIMNDINMQELEKTMTDGDLMASLSNPDSGLTKVLSTVSAKMLAKMASGELQQDTLLQDAMKLAGELGMSGGGGGLGDMGDMIKQMQQMGLNMRGGGGRRASTRRKMRPHKPQSTKHDVV